MFRPMLEGSHRGERAFPVSSLRHPSRDGSGHSWNTATLVTVMGSSVLRERGSCLCVFRFAWGYFGCLQMIQRGKGDAP